MSNDDALKRKAFKLIAKAKIANHEIIVLVTCRLSERAEHNGARF